MKTNSEMESCAHGVYCEVLSGLTPGARNKNSGSTRGFNKRLRTTPQRASEQSHLEANGQAFRDLQKEGSPRLEVGFLGEQV